MEQQYTPEYPPIERRPLKLRGVFGVAWQLYRRGFLSMLLFTLPVTAATALMTIPLLQWVNGLMGLIHAGNDRAIVSMAFRFFPLIIVMLLLSCLVFFLLSPAHMGGMYLEMNQRTLGRTAKAGELFRYAWPTGLKRFYGTYFCVYLLQLGFGVVQSTVQSAVTPLFTLSMVSGVTEQSMGSFMAAMMVLIIVFSALNMVYSVFTSLVYPIAAHEGIYGFKAVGRSFKLGAKNFGRMLGVLALFAGILLVVSLAMFIPLLQRMFQFIMEAMNDTITEEAALQFVQELLSSTGIYMGITVVLQLLLSPFQGALHTALYIDSAARYDLMTAHHAQQNPMGATSQNATGYGSTSYGVPPQPEAQPQQSPPAQASGLQPNVAPTVAPTIALPGSTTQAPPQAGTTAPAPENGAKPEPPEYI